MKRMLIIAYYFPPMGMGGVQRATKFVKYLPEFGWEPIVLTVKDVLYHARDVSLEEDVKGVRVLRTESFDPLRLGMWISAKDSPTVAERAPDLGKVHGWVSRWLSVPDPKILWAPFAIREALHAVSREDYDTIFTTSPPHSAHLIGRYLRKKTGIPWVADFRDDWPGMYFEDLPTRLHAGWNRWTTRRILETADGVVAVSEPIRDGLQRMAGTSFRCEVIRNGYDRRDFEGVGEAARDRFTIAYCGTVSPLLNPSVFLEGAARALDRQPGLRDRLRIRFTGGVVGLDLRGMVDALGLKDLVRIEGYVPHEESVRRLMDSDMLLLLVPDSASDGLVTGKVYEYVASGKPILALAPCGEDERLILRHARGVIVPPGDAEGAAGRILRSFELWDRGDLRITKPRWEGIEAYDRRFLTQRLAGFFDSISG